MQTRSPELLAAIQRQGILNALVAALKHDSPLCVGAAASALGAFWRILDKVDVGAEASGAIPELVRVIGMPPVPGNPATVVGVFRRYVHKSTTNIVTEYIEQTSSEAEYQGSR
jgi:hypothetical protein